MKKKIEKNYIKIFIKILKINNEIQNDLLRKKGNIYLNNFPRWDSIQHVRLLTNIEKIFKIKIDIKNSVKFNSYKSGLKYLNKTKNLYNQT